MHGENEPKCGVSAVKYMAGVGVFCDGTTGGSKSHKRRGNYAFYLAIGSSHLCEEHWFQSKLGCCCKCIATIATPLDLLRVESH